MGTPEADTEEIFIVGSMEGGIILFIKESMKLLTKVFKRSNLAFLKEIMFCTQEIYTFPF